MSFAEQGVRTPLKLVAAFGTSTPLAYWGFSLVRMVAQHLYGDCHCIHCLSFEDFAKGLEARGGRDVVFTSDIPERRLIASLIDARAPFIVFLDEPEESVAYAITSRGLQVRQGIAFSTMCFGALEAVLETPWALVFRSGTHEASVRDVFSRILIYLTGEASAASLDALMAETIDRNGPDHLDHVGERIAAAEPHVVPARTALLDQPERVRTLIGAVCRGYGAIFDRRPVVGVDWPRDVFFMAGSEAEDTDVIGLRGRGRFLVWGPYHWLPAGQWTARVEFEVSGNYSGNTLEVDIHIAGHPVVTLETDLPVAGVYASELVFVHDGVAPVELRVQMMKGAIEGRFLLRSAFVRRTAVEVAPRPAALSQNAPLLVGTSQQL